MSRIGFCRTCERQTSEDELKCPHCGQQSPFDRYEDLELGGVYAADHKGMATEDIHWFKLQHSGRRVFARIAQIGVGNGGHLLELISFEGGFPNFRYKTGRGHQS